MVRDGADAAIVRARLAHGERRVLLEVQLNRQGANKARVNGAPVKPARAAALCARSCSSPPKTCRSSAAIRPARRRFIDQLLVQRTPRLAGVLADYDRVLKQRTALLKSAQGPRSARREACPRSTSGTTSSSPSAPQVIEARLALAAELADPLAARVRRDRRRGSSSRAASGRSR